MAVATAPAFSFTGKNPRAQRAAEKQGAALVTRVTQETRDAIAALIARAIREGIPPVDAARAIRAMVGLTGPQAQAAASYREELINSGLAPAKVDALVDRYTEKKIHERAISIARTETMAALNRGAAEAWAEARAEGLLGKAAMVEWITTPDEKLCPSCAPMDGVQVPLGEQFQTPDGPSDGPPLHPNCRCTSVAVA